MDTSQFTRKASGRLIPALGRGITHAFLADPLPPKWSWPISLWPVLLDAHKALSSLDGIGKHLPDSSLLLRPLQTREAVRSSNLEGTYSDPQEQALFELDPKYPESTDDPVNAQREIFNYSKALRLRQASKHRLPVSLRLIRELHEALMEGVRGSDRDPGHFRRSQNQIGRPARFVPPPPQQMRDALDKLEKYLHHDHNFDPLVEAFLVHYQFEAIHPFMDGNGRVGRLLLALLIEDWCGLSSQWLYMSSFFEAEKDNYMEKLLRVSTHGEWTEWIEFCLRGVVIQAKDTQQRCERLLQLHRDFHERVQQIGGSVRLSAIVNALFENPVLTVPRTASRHRVSYPTARTDLVKLERAHILKRLPRANSISYYCQPIFGVIYAD